MKRYLQFNDSKMTKCKKVDQLKRSPELQECISKSICINLGAEVIHVIAQYTRGYYFESREELLDAVRCLKYGNFNIYGRPKFWDVSTIRDMQDLFNGFTDFNQDISQWDVSNVRNMARMFCKCIAFNQDIGKWDVSQCDNFRGMFFGAEKFNADISKWDTRKAKNMAFMLCDAIEFNQPLSSWNVTTVERMDFFLCHAISFNQNISTWSLENLKFYRDMFKDTYKLETKNKPRF